MGEICSVIGSQKSQKYSIFFKALHKNPKEYKLKHIIFKLIIKNFTHIREVL